MPFKIELRHRIAETLACVKVLADGRRVGKLYLPPGGRFYGCRHCYDLTYTSCQESHKYDRMWWSLAAQLGMDPTDGAIGVEVPRAGRSVKEVGGAGVVAVSVVPYRRPGGHDRSGSSI